VDASMFINHIFLFTRLQNKLASYEHMIIFCKILKLSGIHGCVDG